MPPDPHARYLIFERLGAPACRFRGSRDDEYMPQSFFDWLLRPRAAGSSRSVPVLML